MTLPPLPSLISTAPILGFCTGMYFSGVDVYDPALGTNWKSRRRRLKEKKKLAEERRGGKEEAGCGSKMIKGK